MKKSTYKTRIRFVQKMRRKPIFRTRNVNSSMRYVYNSSRDKHGEKYLKYSRFFSCNFPYSEYKGVIHRITITRITRISMYNAWKLAWCRAQLGSVVFYNKF